MYLYISTCLRLSFSVCRVKLGEDFNYVKCDFADIVSVSKLVVHTYINS